MMSGKENKKDEKPGWFKSSEESPPEDVDFSREMPSWAALPVSDGEWEPEAEKKVSEQSEIPGYPSSITLTWAYFPEFF